MKQIRIIQYLKSLDIYELNRFKSFILSPYFNKHQGTVEAFEYIYKHLKKETSITRKGIFASIHPDEEYDTQKVSNVLSYLMRLFETFISMEKEIPDIAPNLPILQFLKEKKLDTYLEKELQLSLSKSPNALEQYRIHQLSDAYQMERKKRTDPLALKNKDNSLDIFFLVEKFRLGCDMQTRKNVIEGEYDFTLYDILIQYISEKKQLLDYHPTLHLYYLSYMMIRDENQGLFFEIKELILQVQGNMKLEYQKDIYAVLQNFTVKQINKGNRDFLSQLFELYQAILKNGIIFKNGYLSEWEYKNIITAGCRLKKIEWTKHFIESYKEKLEPHARENAYQFNLASFYNTIGNHEETLSVLRDVQFSDVYYHLNTHVILIKTYYALGEFELLFNLLDTFRIYILRNKKISAYQKKLYKNLIRHTTKLAQLSEQRPRLSKSVFLEKRQRIHDAISGNKNTIALDWLMEISTEGVVV